MGRLKRRRRKGRERERNWVSQKLSELNLINNNFHLQLIIVISIMIDAVEGKCPVRPRSLNYGQKSRVLRFRRQVCILYLYLYLSGKLRTKVQKADEL